MFPADLAVDGLVWRAVGQWQWCLNCCINIWNYYVHLLTSRREHWLYSWKLEGFCLLGPFSIDVPTPLLCCAAFTLFFLENVCLYKIDVCIHVLSLDEIARIVYYPIKLWYYRENKVRLEEKQNQSLVSTQTSFSHFWPKRKHTSEVFKSCFIFIYWLFLLWWPTWLPEEVK